MGGPRSPLLALGLVALLWCPCAEAAWDPDSAGGVFGDLAETASEQPCNATRRQEMQRFFGNIVLIIHFNYAWAARSSVSLWLRVYRDLFRHIVLIADEAIPELNVEARSPPKWSRNWRMCYAFLPQFMARFPDADGFLWTNDDVVVNYWNLLRADKSKLWLPNRVADPDVRWFPFDTQAASKWPADWAGYRASRVTMTRAVKLLGARQHRMLSRHTGSHAGHYPKRICDVYFVPQRFAKDFSSLVAVCLEARVPSELCIPLIFHVLDYPKNFDHILDDMIYRWDQWKSKVTGNKQMGLKYFPQKFWEPKASAFHPWKVSRKDSQLVLLQLLKAWDPCLK